MSPSRQAVQAVVDAFCMKVGLPVRSLDERGGASFVCDIEDTAVPIVLLFDEASSTIALSASVARLSLDDPDELSVLRAAMAANLLGAGTGGLAFGWSPAEERLHVGASIELEGFSQAIFEAAFSRVVRGAVHWRRQFHREPRLSLLDETPPI